MLTSPRLRRTGPRDAQTRPRDAQTRPRDAETRRRALRPACPFYPGESTLVLLAADRSGYANLCGLLTMGRLRSPKGESLATGATSRYLKNAGYVLERRVTACR